LPGILIGGKSPNFEANTLIGHIHFHDSLRARVSMLTMVRSPRKCYLFQSLMIRIRSSLSCWACWTQQRMNRASLTACLAQ
uniref:Uncharacterized protein n=1 Tax=Ursus maritimus TaxID=29073 RepID=A0A452UVB9_URSMA